MIKEKFTLLKDVPNILKLSSANIKSLSVDNGPRKIFVPLQMMSTRIDHFTKENVFSLISSIEKRRSLAVVNIPDYNLHVSYNLPSKQMIINLTPFGVDDIYPTNPDPKNLYACLVYAICFKSIVTGKFVVPESYFSVITNYLLSVFVNLFGKEYGLFGIYSTEISKLKFLTACYVLGSFFGVTGKSAHRKAGTVAMIQYKDFEEELNKYDFSTIEDFIKSLSELRVFPGINRHAFTARILRILKINFIPALEDLARFISTITTSNIPGSNIVNTNLFRFNQTEYQKLLEISKLVFR